MMQYTYIYIYICHNVSAPNPRRKSYTRIFAAMHTQESLPQAFTNKTNPQRRRRGAAVRAPVGGSMSNARWFTLVYTSDL